MDKEFALLIAALKNLKTEVRETNTILKDFMAMSIQQWEQQHKFNELIVGESKSIKEMLSTLSQL